MSRGSGVGVLGSGLGVGNGGWWVESWGVGAGGVVSWVWGAGFRVQTLGIRV